MKEGYDMCTKFASTLTTTTHVRNEFKAMVQPTTKNHS